MYSLFMLFVLVVLPVMVAKPAILIITFSMVMILVYAKWGSHFSMVLINLEFFTLLFLLLIFNLSLTTLVNMSVIMVLVTTLVVEACVGLAMLVSMVRAQINESLVSSLN